MTRENQAFWDLRDLDLDFTPAQWQAYYDNMASWLLHDDAEIRSCAVERLTMAVLCAELFRAPYEERDPEQVLQRLSWLLEQIETANKVNSDIIPSFIDELRFKGQDEPFYDPLNIWLNALLKNLPIGLEKGVVEGTLVLFEVWTGDWSQHAKNWIARLDDPSDYLRACTAHRLGGFIDEDCIDPTEAEMIAIIGAIEIERPGIAGPYWSNSAMSWTGSPSPKIRETSSLWMLDLLERRQGHVPAGMPFNDIDFHLHELCATTPHLIRRMMANGFEELAVMTATEWHEPMDGIEPILQDLAISQNAHVASAAQRHLASHYQQIASTVDPSGQNV